MIKRGGTEWDGSNTGYVFGGRNWERRGEGEREIKTEVKTGREKKLMMDLLAFLRVSVSIFLFMCMYSRTYTYKAHMHAVSHTHIHTHIHARTNIHTCR